MNASDLAETTIQRKVKRKDQKKKEAGKAKDVAEIGGERSNVDIDKKKKNMRTSEDDAQEERSGRGAKKGSDLSPSIKARYDEAGHAKALAILAMRGKTDKSVERVGQIKQKNLTVSKSSENNASGAFAVPASPKQSSGFKRNIVHRRKSSV